MSALDDLRSQIRFRGLKQGGFQDPVIEFKGKFDGFDTKQIVFQGQPTDRIAVVLHFSDLEDVKCSEGVYQFPTKDLEIPFSESSNNTRWGHFSESGLKFLAENEEFGSLIEKRLHVKAEMKPTFQGQAKGTQPALCWVIVDVEGVTQGGGGNNGTVVPTVSIEKRLLLLLNGKTQQQFNLDALRLDDVKKDSALVQTLLSNTWFGEVTAKGLVTKDDGGIYALTAEGLASLQ